MTTETLQGQRELPAGSSEGRRPEPASFLTAHPTYASTARLDWLRATEYSYLDAGGHVYLDYAGAALPAQAQIAAHAHRLNGSCFGNPHSQSPTSAASSELVESVRQAVLSHFRAPPDEYAVVFTANATAACRLVGESYPFGPRDRLVLTADNHNSVNGIREFARSRGGRTQYVQFQSPGLRIAGDAVRDALARSGKRLPRAARAAAPRRHGLFAYPAQSNFSGVQHPLSWIETAHQLGYDVLLDAAAYVPTNRLDLSVVKPDFVPVSWYKVFGYPTGVGCLIARREALARLRRPWFGGGSVYVASVRADWHTMAAGETGFEDGTVSYLQVPDLATGLSWINSIGVDVIHERVACLTGWLLHRLTGLRHGNGEPMARIYGPAEGRGRGGTVAFNVLDPDGCVIDERAVARAAGAAGISIRTGCFCNPGAVEGAFGLTRADWGRALRAGARTLDQYLDLLGMPGGGAVRASVGLASNARDIERLAELIETAFRDRRPGSAGLAPRRGC